MIAIEFRLKVSSMYSIRVPYSYQCARTYPLPAPSTIKGLCANALWRKEGGDPVALMKTIHEVSLGATSRAEQSIAVSSCTVQMVPKNVLLRQFAFTPNIDCLIVFRDDGENVGKRVEEALKVSPIYLGDSESLVCVKPESIYSTEIVEDVTKGQEVIVNSLLKFDFIKDKPIDKKGIALYMQDDPIDSEAVLERYIAPLIQEGDNYKPLNSISFISAKKAFIVKGQRVRGIFCYEDKQTEKVTQKSKRGRKKKE